MPAFDESELNDTPETAPVIPQTLRQADAKKARELRDGPVFKNLKAKFRDDCARVNAPCHLCFGPDTLIRTFGGYAPIKDVEAGDQILSSDGTWQTVVRVFQRQFSGDAVLLRTSTMTRPVIMTADHPILGLYADHDHSAKLFTDENGPFCSPGLCLPCSWHIGAHGHQQRVPNVERRMRGKLHELRWLPAERLKVRSWAATAAPTAEDDITDISIPYVAGRKGPTTFELTDEFLWMVGLYIAEGSTESRSRWPHRTLAFSLHRDELDYQQRIMDLFKSLGYTASIRPSGAPGTKGVQIHVSSTNLGQWFAHWIGVGCQKKRIPEELMRLPYKQARHIIRGVYDGDGYGETLGQTSEILALQIMELAARGGVMATCYIEEHPAAAPSGNPRKPVYSVRWPNELRSAQSGRWRLFDTALTQVRQHDAIHYNGPVYNLEVTGNTYVVQNIAVHNCGGDIDYRQPYPHPQGFELDHIITVKDRPDLLMDPLNFGASHHSCNQERGTDDPPLHLGEPSEVW
jgi:hypothetical protein